MGTEPSAQSEHAHAQLMPRAGYLLALVVLVGLLVFVLFAWHAARERELRAAEAQFVARTGEMADRLRRGIDDYELIARGGTALFASMTRPTPQQWGDYVDSLRLRQRFPALFGFGFVGRISNSRLDDLQVEWRNAGYGQLNIRPHGMRPDYAPVLYLEPRTPGNLSAIGLDLMSDAAGSHAMQLAMDSGAAQLSGPLSDDYRAPPALAMFVPVYRDGEHPAGISARREAMQGWVFLPFDLGRCVDNSLGARYADVALRIFDVQGGAAIPLYAREGTEKSAFHHALVVDIHGRKWRMEFDSPPLAIAAPRLKGLENMLALGLIASLLLYGTVWTMARTEDRAKAMALRMTEDYRSSEQRFRMSMRYSAIGKALLDSEGRIVEANPALGRIVGRPFESLVGEPFDSLFDEGDGSARPRDDGETDAQGIHRVTRHLRREGDLPRQAQLTYAPLDANIGQDISGLVQVEDVTERVRAQARIQALNRTLEARVAMRTVELSQANQELEAFAYSVSHDLRAPLRAIDGFSRMLGERYAPQLDEAGRDYLQRIRRAAARMGELIDAILLLSRLGRAELKREDVDLTRMALEVVDELRADDPGRDVEIRIAPELKAVGDAALLRNVLGNLLGNAWKFTRGRERAVIEFGLVDRSGDECEFYVRDNGAGFDQAYVEKLFRPFQRLHSQEEFAGHGVGLASVRRIIERHGGRIRAEGREGEGAVFCFVLPRDASS